MSKMNKLTKIALLGTFSLGTVLIGQAGTIKPKKLSTIPTSVPNPQVGEIIYKCAGIAAKGKNHCGANGHDCGGLAKTDFDKNEWIYVRKEVCDATPGRIVGKKRIVKG